MMKYDSLVNEIVKSVGGEKNIDNVYHCATRLRFTLKDKEKASKSHTEDIEGVLKVVESGGMFQVVIGNNVNEVYDTLIKSTNLESSSNSNEEKSEKKGIFNSFIEMIASVFAPTLGVLSGTGLIKGLLALLIATNILTTESGTYVILNAAGDSFFYFLPVFLAYTSAKKFKADSFTSMAIAGALVYPTIVQSFTDGVGLTFMNLPVILVKYTSTVIPIIIAIWVLSYIEKYLKSIFHDSVRNLLTPFFSILIMVPLTLLVVGPIADIASQAIANAYLFLFNLSPLISGAVIGGFWQVLVMFGLHWGMVPVMTNNLSYYGRDTVGPGCFMAVSAQAGAVLGVFLKTKNKKLKTISLSAFISALFGITEPGVYGVNLKYKKPFFIACFVGAIFGAVVGAAGASAIAIGPRSILTFPIYIGKGFPILVISYFLAMILSCILTYLFGFKDENQNENTDNKILAKEVFLESPVRGEIIELSSVNDETFASGALGNGFAVIPSDDVIVSPVIGKITTIFPTKHAIGITGDTGEEVLIHVGIDTVNLKGEGFETLVSVGKKVKNGDNLLRINRKHILDEGYDTTVMVVVTNSGDFDKINIPNNS